MKIEEGTNTAELRDRLRKLLHTVEENEAGYFTWHVAIHNQMDSLIKWWQES